MTDVDGKLIQMQHRLTQVGTMSVNRIVPAEQYKIVTFNGDSEYPLEFINELRDIHREVYPGNGVNWIGRYLEGEAAIWWKLTRGTINSFPEFVDAFVNKYWDALTQENVRDRLEFGRYRGDTGLSLINYMERRVLENRQLIPPMTDKHLIRKLARHYNHNIEVAIITRGVKTIPELGQVLHEFMYMRGNQPMNMPPKENRQQEPAQRQGRPWQQKGSHSAKPAVNNLDRQNKQSYSKGAEEEKPKHRYVPTMNAIASSSKTQTHITEGHDPKN